MTQQEKDKLLKYLCAALPYDVFMTNKEYPQTHYPFTWREVHDLMYEEDFDDVPYLRPMSSMTKEELKEFYAIEDIHSPVIWNKPQTNWRFSIKGIVGLLENHFDFIGLINEGIAIDCTDLNIYKD